MKIVYLAGPYRADTAAEVERNIQNARRYHMALTEAGIFSFCPHVHMAHYDGLQEEQWFLDGTMEMMRRCDALVVMPGHAGSDGTRLEINEAKRIGIDILQLSERDDGEIVVVSKYFGWWPLKSLREALNGIAPRNKDVK